MPRFPAAADPVETLPRPLAGWSLPASNGSARPADENRPGLDFATSDCLALASHPALRTAAMAALGKHRLALLGTGTGAV